MSEVIEAVGCDGVTYELVPLAELASRDDEHARKAVKWLGQNRGHDKVWLAPSLVDAIEQAFDADDKRWGALYAFRPPKAGLTVEDYVKWATMKIQELDNRYGGQKSRYGFNSYNTTRNYHIGSWDPARYGAGWREEVTAQRSRVPAPGPGNGYNRMGYAITSILEESWAPRKNAKQGRDAAQELILLNEYLWGEGKAFAGTFGEFLASDHASFSPELEKRYERYEFVELEPHTRDALLTFGSQKHVATLNHATQKRVRDLLHAQDREVWHKLIKAGPSYTKGKTFKHLQELLTDIDVELGRSRGQGFPIYPTDKLRREFTLLVAEGIMFEGPYYNPKKLHGLATVALKAVPEEHQLQRFAKEYSHILHLVREKLAAHKSSTELELLLSEDQDQAAMKKAAEQAGKLTLMQTVGLLMATFFPKSWIRGNSENGPYLLVDLLKARDDLAVLQLISEMIFEVHPAVPTETEWRKSIETVDFNVPAGLFIPLAVSATAVDKAARKGYPDIVHEARACFGVRR